MYIIGNNTDITTKTDNINHYPSDHLAIVCPLPSTDIALTGRSCALIDFTNSPLKLNTCTNPSSVPRIIEFNSMLAAVILLSFKISGNFSYSKRNKQSDKSSRIIIRIV
jgi:hypothetical protein